MVHSVSGWTWGVQVKLWDPLRTHAIPECLRGVFTTRRCTNNNNNNNNPICKAPGCQKTSVALNFKIHWNSRLPLPLLLPVMNLWLQLVVWPSCSHVYGTCLPDGTRTPAHCAMDCATADGKQAKKTWQSIFCEDMQGWGDNGRSASCLNYAWKLEYWCIEYLIFILWVRSFSTRLTSVTFAEDKVLIFLILRKNAKIVQLWV